MSNHNKEKGRGTWIEVRNNNVDQAMRKLKKKLNNEGVFQELRDRKHFISNTEKRLKAEAAGRARLKKKQAKDNW
jgi:small subunit ribosomal protein S21